jgi:hypothetical protein
LERVGDSTLQNEDVTVLSWSKGQFPPELTYVFAALGIAGAVLLVLAYFAVNVWLKRPIRSPHDEQHSPEEDLGSGSCSGTEDAQTGPH